MQKFTVKTILPATEENKPTVITTEDGAKMSGFEAGLKTLNPGDDFNADIEVKGKYINIKKWECLGPAHAPARPNVHNGLIEVSPDELRLERRSQEAIACFTGIVALVGNRDIQLDGKLKEIYDAALEWALAHFKPTKAPMPTAPKTEADKAFDAIDSAGSPQYKNVGEFLTKALRELDMKPAEICEKLSINNVSEIKDFSKAWKDLTGKESEAKSDRPLTPENIPFS